MTKHEGQTFEKQTFVLEECYFVNCVLRECDLFYSGGDFEWTGTSFDGCTIHWRGMAKNTLALMRWFQMLKEGEKPQTLLKTSTGPVN